MNVLLLESAYSSFHSDLLNEFDGEKYCFLFDVGYFLFNRSLNLISVRKEISAIEVSDADIELVANIPSLQTAFYQKVKNQNIDASFLIIAAKYSVYLREFLMEKSIAFVLMHNDLRWQHAIAIKILNSEGIPYFVTERGMVRPYTTTLDPFGVNANSEVVRSPREYCNYAVVNPSDFRGLPAFDKVGTYGKFAAFLLLSKLGDLFGLNINFRHKKFSLFTYSKLYFKQLSRKSSNVDVIHHSLPSSYVYFPLQVQGDSQVLIHSDFSSMQEAISVIEAQFYSADLGVTRLVVNFHPMEPDAPYYFDSRTVISDAPTELLVDNCDSVITINSTVGVEAMRKGKIVHLLGRAYFSDENYMFLTPKGRGLSTTLRKQLLDKSFPLRAEFSKEFIDEISMRNQVLGDVYQYNQRTIKKVVAIMTRTLLSRSKPS
jgi:capsular polysaccharide export protein